MNNIKLKTANLSPEAFNDSVLFGKYFIEFSNPNVAGGTAALCACVGETEEPIGRYFQLGADRNDGINSRASLIQKPICISIQRYSKEIGELLLSSFPLQLSHALFKIFHKNLHFRIARTLRLVYTVRVSVRQKRIQGTKQEPKMQDERLET